MKTNFRQFPDAGRYQKPPEKKLGWLGMVLLGLFCIGLPAAFTAMIPISYLTLTRSNDQIHASARICLLFIVPYRTLRLDNVDAVSSQFVAGTLVGAADGSTNPEKQNRSEDQGFLVLHSDDRTMEVGISPTNMDSVEADIKNFFNDKSRTTSRYICASNWTFNFWFGIPLLLLTLGYLLIIIHPVVSFCRSTLMRLIHGKSQHRPAS